MKKQSKTMHKNYKKVENMSDRIEYYGLYKREGRVKIDTKRYKKYFVLPDKKIELRTTVYYAPSKQHWLDYKCNWFRNLFNQYKKLWLEEYKSFIDSIKTPKQVMDNTRLDNISQGYLNIDEVNEKSLIAGLKRDNEYKIIIKSIYAQFFHQLMSSVDALCLRLLTECGYREEDYSKKQFDIYIQGLQGSNSTDFRHFDNFKIYDKCFTVWNFLKHNSLKSYRILKTHYPEMIWDPEEKYQNGQSALTVTKISEKFIVDCLNDLHLFFDELCSRAFKENAEDAQWDYDDYFYNEVKDQINVIINPLDI